MNLRITEFFPNIYEEDPARKWELELFSLHVIGNRMSKKSLKLYNMSKKDYISEIYLLQLFYCPL
jgi:hypothetical protein